MIKNTFILIICSFLFFNFFNFSFAQTTSVEISEISENNNESSDDDFGNRLKFFGALVPAALADSINPCAFAVLLLLLSTILSRHNSTKKVFWSGFLFILAVFISYVAIGFGIYEALSNASNIYYLKLSVGVLGLIVGLLNLKDYFYPVGLFGFKMEVPDAWKPIMKNLIEGVTSPLGAFFVGFLVSLILLPCTSGPYITILGYMASENEFLNIWGYIYMLIYNIIFILPLIVITFLVGFGFKTVKEISQFRNKNIRSLKLIIALLMIGLALFIFWDIGFFKNLI